MILSLDLKAVLLLCSHLALLETSEFTPLTLKGLESIILNIRGLINGFSRWFVRTYSRRLEL